MFIIRLSVPITIAIKKCMLVLQNKADLHYNITMKTMYN